MVLLSLSEEYNNRVENYIYDVTDHMDKLRTYAGQCSHVTELGIGNIGSTFAFMMGQPANLVSYDADPIEIREINGGELAALGLTNGVNFTFVEQDSIGVTIDPTDLLFIHDATDSSRLSQQLSNHSSKASKFIIIPIFGVDRDAFLLAIDNFVSTNPSWIISENIQGWCSLVVLAK